MSQRASFVTEYLYCAPCADAVEAVLCRERSKDLCAVRIRSWEPQGGTLPIVAGKLGGSYIGAEVFELNEMRHEIESLICHPVHIAVMPDQCGALAVTVIMRPQHRV